MQSEPLTDYLRVMHGLLNMAHALDHLFLLIFAAAVSTMAADMGPAQWQDLMLYDAGAFFMFGLGVSFAVSSWSVRALGPVVKAMGFGSSLLLLMGFPLAATLILTLLPGAAHQQQTLV